MSPGMDASRASGGQGRSSSSSTPPKLPPGNHDVARRPSGGTAVVKKNTKAPREQEVAELETMAQRDRRRHISVQQQQQRQTRQRQQQQPAKYLSQRQTHSLKACGKMRPASKCSRPCFSHRIVLCPPAQPKSTRSSKVWTGPHIKNWTQPRPQKSDRHKVPFEMTILGPRAAFTQPGTM